MKLKNTTPFILTIYGGSGDLAKLKIYPALYKLYCENGFPKEFHIIGFARSKYSLEEFQELFTQSIKDNVSDVDETHLSNLLAHLSYFQGKYSEKSDFERLLIYQKSLTSDKNTLRISYFSVPPSVFDDIIENIGSTETHIQNTRLILEKPFGDDELSATKLFHLMGRHFKDENFYLLDHYLGKSAVQSVLNLRNRNKVLGDLIQGNNIANIQITAFEKLGVENRIGYFDQVGTLKDMIQSHLLQILSLLTMSIPITSDAVSLHREKFAILSALSFSPSTRNIAIGQYSGYKNNDKVPQDSKTETFAAVRLLINRQSWHNVPIYIRTGKKLQSRNTYITIEFKKFPFQDQADPPNRIVIELQPKESIALHLLGHAFHTSKSYSIAPSESITCKESQLPEHALLLKDVIAGNHKRFLSFPEIIASWKIIDTILQFIRKKNITPEIYKPNSKGPSTQQTLTEKDNYTWFDL